MFVVNLDHAGLDGHESPYLTGTDAEDGVCAGTRVQDSLGDLVVCVYSYQVVVWVIWCEGMQGHNQVDCLEIIDVKSASEEPLRVGLGEVAHVGVFATHKEG